MGAHSAMTRSFNAHLQSTAGMTVTDFEVLRRLAEEEGGRMRRVDLAPAVGLTPSGITRLLDGLEAAILRHRGRPVLIATGVALLLAIAGAAQIRTYGSTREYLAHGSIPRDHLEQIERHFPGTVTMTQASIGAGKSGISKRCQRKAKPRGRPSCGSIVHCRVSVLPLGFTTSSPSLNVRKTTMPRWPAWYGVRNGSRVSMVSDRAWIGCGRRQSCRDGNPQRILTTRRLRVSGSHTMTGSKPLTRKVTISSLLPSDAPGSPSPPPSASGCENSTTSAQDARAVNLPHIAAR